MFDNYVTDIELDGKPIQLALWDTAGQEEYERLRPLSYSKAHIILIAYSVDTPDSLDNVTQKVSRELRAQRASSVQREGCVRVRGCACHAHRMVRTHIACPTARDAAAVTMRRKRRMRPLSAGYAAAVSGVCSAREVLRRSRGLAPSRPAKPVWRAAAHRLPAFPSLAPPRAWPPAPFAPLSVGSHNADAQWIEEVRNICGSSIPVILVACKRDLRDKAVANGTFNKEEFIDEATVSTWSLRRVE